MYKKLIITLIAIFWAYNAYATHTILKGDILLGSGSLPAGHFGYETLTVGADNLYLMASSTATYGVAWQAVTSSGITSLNGLSGSSQTFATSTVGTNFSITSSGTIHTFNLPYAGSVNTGILTFGDWATFNSKQAAITDGTGLTFTGVTLNCDTASGSVQGCLTSADWTTFNNKQATVTDGANLTFSGATLNVDDPFSVTKLTVTNASTTLATIPTLWSTNATFSATTTLSSALLQTGMTDCDTAASSKVLYDLGSGKFSCGTDATGAGTWTTTVKTSDQVNNTTTLADATMLQFTTVANTQYTIRLRVQLLTNATADSKYRLVHSGTTTRVDRRVSRTATTDIAVTTELKTAFDAADVVLSTTGLNPWVEEDIVIIVGASGGVLKFQFGEVTANAAGPTVLEGSYIEYASS